MFVHAPAAFSGSIEDFFEQYVVPNLPSTAIVAHYHNRLMEYCRLQDPIFVVRQIQPLERGTIYVTNTGSKLKASDNSPAWWLHAMMREERTFTPNTFEQAILTMPTHIFQVKKHTKQTINDFGWHVAHIYNAKNGDTNYRAWDRNELIRRFIRNIHPCNCFYIAKTAWQSYGGDPAIIAFFAERYAARYGMVWNEFRALAQGEAFTNRASLGGILYTYGAQQPRDTPKGREATIDRSHAPIMLPTIVYEAKRLTFKAAEIEPLLRDESFRIVTPLGIFQMTKEEFYRDFDNVAKSASYRDRGSYNYSALSAKALWYRIADWEPTIKLLEDTPPCSS